MKYVRGFLMAWGCFCWIPCPYKKWNDDDREAMVAMLPLVGTGLALLTGIVWAIVALLGGSALLTGAVITAAYFVMTGFIHLDGFMDVCDAVMPRHPVMEERIRILKDPHTGSFAAVSMALMFLVFAASSAELAGISGGISGGDGIPGGIAGSVLPWCGPAVLVAVMTTSRCISAVSVLACRPMGTSQYATTDFGKGGTFRKAFPAMLVTALVLAACALACLEGPHVFGQLPGMAADQMQAAGGSAALCVLASVAVCVITQLIIGALDRRSLGGMNGDISGHMITSGEMAGVLAAAILIGGCL